MKNKDFSAIGNALSTAEFKGMVIVELKYIKERLTEINGKTKKNDERIDKLEKWQLKIITIAGCVSGGVSVVFYVLKEYLDKLMVK